MLIGHASENAAMLARLALEPESPSRMQQHDAPPFSARPCLAEYCAGGPTCTLTPAPTPAVDHHCPDSPAGVVLWP